jgi:hypothetical protein
MLEAEDVMQLPIVETVGGRPVKFARLDMGDLVKWCAEEKAARKRDTIQRLALVPNMDPGQKNEELRKADAQRVTIGHLAQLVDEPEGIQKVLRKSLVKSGEAKTNDEADAILSRIHWSGQQGLAIAAMSPPPVRQEAGQTPLAETAGASDNAGSGPTGS